MLTYTLYIYIYIYIYIYEYIYIYINIYIYIYIYMRFMLSALSSKVLEALKGVVIYVWGILTTINCYYTVFHELNPVFRWFCDTIFICSKNKSTWKLTPAYSTFQRTILNTSNLKCPILCSINSLTILEWWYCCSNSLNAVI